MFIGRKPSFLFSGLAHIPVLALEKAIKVCTVKPYD